MICTGCAAGFALACLYLKVAPLAVLALLMVPVCLVLLLKHPEVSFMLLLTSGAFKADPRLAFLPSFLDVTIVLSLITALAVMLQIMKGKTPLTAGMNWYVICFLLLVILAMLSLAYTPAPIYGKEKFLRFATLSLISFMAPFYIFKSSEDYRNFFFCFVFMAMAMIVDSIFSTAGSPTSAGFKSAFGSNYLVLAGTSASALLISFVYLSNIFKGLVAFLSLALIPFFIFGALVSGGRGPVIALALALGCLFLLLLLIHFMEAAKGGMPQVERRMLVKFLILGVVAIAVVIPFFDAFSVFFDRMELLLSGGGDSAGERVDRFRASFSVFQSPLHWITGLGIGGFSFFYAAFDDLRGAYPHNLILEFATEFGLPGLAIFAFLIFRTFRACALLKAIRDHRARVTLYTLTGLFIMLFVSSQFSGDLNDNRMLFASMAMILAFNPSGGREWADD